MISFIFRVNKSFLEYSNHPITIPRDKEELLIKEVYEGMGGRNQEIEILPPGSSRILEGHIYYGVTGDSPYYQIKVLGSYPSDYFGHLKIGTSLMVKIEKKDDIVQVSMKIDDPIQAYVDKFAAATAEEQMEMMVELKKRIMKIAGEDNRTGEPEVNNRKPLPLKNEWGKHLK